MPKTTSTKTETDLHTRIVLISGMLVAFVLAGLSVAVLFLKTSKTPTNTTYAVPVPTLPVSSGIWISPTEIMSIPITGQPGCLNGTSCATAWNALLAQANQSAGTPDVSNQDQQNDVFTLAKALVHVRTGIESYRTEVRQSVMAAIGTEVGGSSLALSRNLSGYIIAAELVELESAEDTTFRSWLRGLLTQVMSDGRTLRSIHEDRPNNYGTHGGASRAAVAIYLGDTAELARTAQVFKGWLGDRSSYAGFSYGDLAWQCDSASPVGINPVGCVRGGESLDGSLPEEMRRGGGLVFPPGHTDYTWEAMQGATVQAQILYRRGYDTWNWQNQALRRAAQFLFTLDQRYDGWWATGDDEWTPWLVNWAYGTVYPAIAPANPGKNMGWTDWTHHIQPPTPPANPPTGGGCFPAGTMVNTPTGLRAIDQLKRGDRVYAYDQVTDRTVVSKVSQTLVHRSEPYGVVTFSDGSSLEVTAVHRFYNPQTTQWQEIGRMKLGDAVVHGLGADARVVMIRSMEFTSHHGTVYNLEVDRYHTYYVNGVLVHNAKQKN